MTEDTSWAMELRYSWFLINAAIPKTTTTRLSAQLKNASKIISWRSSTSPGETDTTDSIFVARRTDPANTATAITQFAKNTEE